MVQKQFYIDYTSKERLNHTYAIYIQQIYYSFASWFENIQIFPQQQRCLQNFGLQELAHSEGYRLDFHHMMKVCLQGIFEAGSSNIPVNRTNFYYNIPEL